MHAYPEISTKKACFDTGVNRFCLYEAGFQPFFFVYLSQNVEVPGRIVARYQRPEAGAASQLRNVLDALERVIERSFWFIECFGCFADRVDQLIQRNWRIVGNVKDFSIQPLCIEQQDQGLRDIEMMYHVHARAGMPL